MKYILSTIIGLLILSCVQTNKSKEDNRQITKLVDLETEKVDKPIEQKSFNLQDKVFEIASKTHYTDKCSFYFACDCCLGELIFNSDSTFYYINYCMSDETVRKGNFSFKNNIYVLKYNPESVMKRYNYEREFDTTAIEYFKTDTILKTVIIEYLPRICDNKLMLEDEKHGEYAIEKSSDYSEALKYLKEEKYIDRINSLAK